MEKRFVPLKSAKSGQLAPLASPSKKEIVSLDAKPESKTEAEILAEKRSLLKEAWRPEVVKALSTAGYCRPGDAQDLVENNREMLVLNFDRLGAPRDEAENALLWELIDEISETEPTVIEHFRRLHRDQAELTDRRFDARLATLRQNALTASRVEPSRFQPLPSPKKQLVSLLHTQQSENPHLVHPDWYLGFWDDTEIQIGHSDPAKVFRLDTMNDLVQIGGFQPFEMKTKEVIKTVESKDGWQPEEIVGVALVKIGQENKIPRFPIYLTRPIGSHAKINWKAERIAKFYSLNETSDQADVNWDNLGVFPEMDMVAHHIKGSKKNNSEEKGLLLVFNASRWKNNIDSERRCIDTNAFDQIHIEIEARKSLVLRNLKITLNGCVIIELDYDAFLIPAGKTIVITDTDKIWKSKKHKLLYQGDDFGPLYPLSYQPQEILDSRILSTAVGELGQAWNPKYGTNWPKKNGIWDNIPEFWCTEFAAWALRVSGDFPQIPSVHSTFEMEEFFKKGANRQFISAEDTSNTWLNIANKVQPGAYVALENSNHSTIFIYWIGPNGARRPCNGFYPELKEIVNDLDNTQPNDDTKPGNFNSNYALNWFKAIGGNQGGKVCIRYFAIVRLDASQRSWIDKLTNKNKKDKSVVVWCKVSQSDPLKAYDGFGIKK
ncbi:MAG: hypothetical protein GX444_14575 [Myxococcales bacterium]|nr:hypothetical protein [Myxococcales bacterium]